jgi:hypothetical protein
MIRALRSYFTAMPAVRRFGRASRLREKGRNNEALRLAREALEILRRPGVIRTNPAESAVLSCATVLVEELAHELKQPGADSTDISDTLSIIRANGSASDFQSWVPYLESRLGKGNASAV